MASVEILKCSTPIYGIYAFAHVMSCRKTIDTLWLFNIAMVWPIEIDALPFLKMVDLSMAPQRSAVLGSRCLHGS